MFGAFLLDGYKDSAISFEIFVRMKVRKTNMKMQKREAEGGQRSDEECRQKHNEGEDDDEDEMEEGQAENSDVAVSCQQFSEPNQPYPKFNVKEHLANIWMHVHVLVLRVYCAFSFGKIKKTLIFSKIYFISKGN